MVVGFARAVSGFRSRVRKTHPAGLSELRTPEASLIGIESRQFSDYNRKQGARVGLNWRTRNVRGKLAVRHVVCETNWWNSFVHARLAVAMGDRGFLSLFGSIAEMNRLFAQHVSAQYFVKTEDRGRTVDEWKMRPEQADNHWLDCQVGCAVAPSIQGAVLFGTDGPLATQRARLKFSLHKRMKGRHSRPTDALQHIMTAAAILGQIVRGRTTAYASVIRALGNPLLQLGVGLI